MLRRLLVVSCYHLQNTVFFVDGSLQCGIGECGVSAAIISTLNSEAQFVKMTTRQLDQSVEDCVILAAKNADSWLATALNGVGVCKHTTSYATERRPIILADLEATVAVITQTMPYRRGQLRPVRIPFIIPSCLAGRAIRTMGRAATAASNNCQAADRSTHWAPDDIISGSLCHFQADASPPWPSLQSCPRANPHSGWEPTSSRLPLGPRIDDRTRGA
ncbi:unnamed protein product, partial [Protopolystoma xenopodis]